MEPCGRRKSWVLADSAARVWLDQFETGSTRGRSGRKAGWHVSKRTLHGGLSDGIELVRIDNGVLSFSVLPTRGMGIWQAEYRGIRVGWNSPVRGPVHPKFVNMAERGGMGWLRGFDEMLARCGLESNGPPCEDTLEDATGRLRPVGLTLHGRIANLPAQRVALNVEPGEGGTVEVEGMVEESALFMPRLRLESRTSTVTGANSIRIEDRITNVGGTQGELQILYHFNFGPPFLEEGARVVAPASVVAPRDRRASEEALDYAAFRGPEPGYREQVYFLKLAAERATGSSAVMLRNKAGDLAVLLKFGARQLPCFTLWKNTAAEADGYVVGLEPGTNYPNPKPFERAQGRVVRLPPGGSFHAKVQLEIIESKAAVSAAEAKIRGLARGRPPALFRRPQPGYSPR